LCNVLYIWFSRCMLCLLVFWYFFLIFLYFCYHYHHHPHHYIFIFISCISHLWLCVEYLPTFCVIEIFKFCLFWSLFCGDSLALLWLAVDCDGVTWLAVWWWLLLASRSRNGRSRLVIESAMKKDDGTYMCRAENTAGMRRAVAAVRVKGQSLISTVPY